MKSFLIKHPLLKLKPDYIASQSAKTLKQSLRYLSDNFALAIDINHIPQLKLFESKMLD
jgi:hypothetical protein